MAKRPLPEVNAGSMADIAFLLLIFFLVTTTIESDYGITRKLPPIQDENVEPPVIKERNIFKVLIRSKQSTFSTELTLILPRDGSQHKTPAHNYSNFKFRTYAPLAFR